MPGTYSLYPKSDDEVVTYEALFTNESTKQAQAILIIVDASNLKRNLLFATQIMDLGKPVIIALTMVDVAQSKGVIIDKEELSRRFGVPVLAINPRKSKGITELKRQIAQTLKQPYTFKPFYVIEDNVKVLTQKISVYFKHLTPYACLHLASETNLFQSLSKEEQLSIEQFKQEERFNKNKLQASEIYKRYAQIKNIIQASVVEEDPLKKELRTEQLDKVLLHPFYGNIILLAVLFLLFQAIFWLASFPMDWIDIGFAKLSSLVENILPISKFTNLFINGVIAGLGGIIMFVPQIVILFALINILEDTGYMARISFLTDRLMRSAGLNGKSVLPMISGMACAVPAIMSARTIENAKERLITILITPLMSCSARLPVYTILIALVIPNKIFFGFISLQGLVMMALYLLGFIIALVVAKICSWFIKTKGKSIFLMELPIYKSPRWSNILITVIEKAKIFVWEAGKVIMVVSLVLWALSNFGPDKFKQLEKLSASGATTVAPAQLLEASYTGIIGKTIQPIFKPLGYDWKISIALLSSFAAREVFVGTMATLYSTPNADENSATLKQKLQIATHTNGAKVYTVATGISLMLFYVFAMQCMSTMAIVYKETGKLKYPIYQFIFMFALAYLFALAAYNIF